MRPSSGTVLPLCVTHVVTHETQMKQAALRFLPARKLPFPPQARADREIGV